MILCWNSPCMHDFCLNSLSSKTYRFNQVTRPAGRLDHPHEGGGAVARLDAGPDQGHLEHPHEGGDRVTCLKQASKPPA